MAEIKSDLASELHGKIGDKLYRTLAKGKIVVTPPSKEPTFMDKKEKEKQAPDSATDHPTTTEEEKPQAFEKHSENS